jgi:hypothetical protein
MKAMSAFDARPEENIALFGNAGEETLDRRLAELDYEWDIERTLEANAGSVILLGGLLGATVDRKWFLVSTAAAEFLLQHAIQGWCPPMGLRLQNRHRNRLRALRL